MSERSSRRDFLKNVGLATAAVGLTGNAIAAEAPKIVGFDDTGNGVYSQKKSWDLSTDRKIRVGIAGYGVCRFGAQFGFQDHPNVEIVAVTDIVPKNCDALSKAVSCDKKYPSAEEMFKDDSIEAVFIATDAASHCRLAIDALKHGKHVATAVPAVWGSVDDAHELFEAVKKSGLNYMMYETSSYHADLHAMREIYKAGGFGKLVYSEGEYYHYLATPIDSYKGWRVGCPPLYYPTHSDAYYISVTDASFTEVTCYGMPSLLEQFKDPNNNLYRNPFATEVGLFRTSEGGMSRITCSWDTPGDHGERGRIRGQKGSFYGKYEGLAKVPADINRPALPKGMKGGGHGGSHGHLTCEFISSIIENRRPLVDICQALNMTVAGIVAHQSALKDGETMKIPQFVL
jgi:predicted dehydrogenase